MGGGCSLAHASRCLHNVLYLCAARAQVREAGGRVWRMWVVHAAESWDLRPRTPAERRLTCYHVQSTFKVLEKYVLAPAKSHAVAVREQGGAPVRVCVLACSVLREGGGERVDPCCEAACDLTRHRAFSSLFFPPKLREPCLFRRVSLVTCNLARVAPFLPLLLFSCREAEKAFL